MGLVISDKILSKSDKIKPLDKSENDKAKGKWLKISVGLLLPKLSRCLLVKLLEGFRETRIVVETAQ